MQLSEDELRRPINGHEEVELALLSANLGNVEVEVADRITLEGFFSDLVTGDLRQTADRVAFKAPMQGRPGQMRDRRLQGIEAVVSGSSVCLRKATMIASSLDDSTVECGVFGPIGASLTKARLRHLATVLWFSPCRAASSLSGAFDRCIAVRTACVVVAQP